MMSQRVQYSARDVERLDQRGGDMPDLFEMDEEMFGSIGEKER